MKIIRNGDATTSVQIFSEIDYLLHYQNSEKEKDSQFVIEWIDNFILLFNKEDFTPLTMARFFDVLNIVKVNHPKMSRDVDHYFLYHPQVSSLISEKAYELLLSSKVRDMIHILKGMISSDVFNISEDWMKRWFDCSKNHLSSANYQDLGSMLNILYKLNKKPPQEWVDLWSIQCEIQLYEFHNNPILFFRILSSITKLSLSIDPPIIEMLVQNAVVYLDHFSHTNEIYLMSRFFKLEQINRRYDFVKEWFTLTGERLLNAKQNEVKYICEAFLYVQKLEEDAPLQWIRMCSKIFVDQFKHLTFKDMGICLYGMALLQIEKDEILPFLKECKLKIKNEFKEKVLKFNSYSDLRHYALSQFYFKTKGFDLGVETDEVDFFLKSKKGKNSIRHGELSLLMCLQQYKEVEVTSEYWVKEIADSVDFGVQRGNGLKLIEYDGPYHEINGRINRLTQLKTYLLQSYGYDLLRIHYRDTPNMESILKENLNLN